MRQQIINEIGNYLINHSENSTFHQTQLLFFFFNVEKKQLTQMFTNLIIIIMIYHIIHED